MKKILFAGAYELNYNRTHVIYKGLLEQGYKIEHINVPITSPLKRTRDLKKCFLKNTHSDFDIVFIPSFCHYEVPVIRKLTDKAIIFDPLISRYISKIYDFEKPGFLGWYAYANKRIDKLSFGFSDIILSDTITHGQCYSEFFKINPRKLKIIYVGYNDEDFFPVEKDCCEFKIGHYGNFQPLNGIETILKAATILKNMPIKFEFIGDNQAEFKRKANLIRPLEQTGTLTLLGKKPYNELYKYINNWDICLGIFGKTLKADIVIPNKVFHYAGCRRPIITAQTKAIKELFRDGESIALCEPTPEALASCVEKLYADSSLRNKIAHGAYEVVKNRCTYKTIGKQMADLIESL
ncbi:MAG: glycosyltransferase [Chitinispirillales bacterium]|jgi:glycosyltransferase involved in cell wall biosynthesis|nr:glycosyltransferase [Chitinispirillales bacterium]